MKIYAYILGLGLLIGLAACRSVKQTVSADSSISAQDDYAHGRKWSKQLITEFFLPTVPAIPDFTSPHSPSPESGEGEVSHISGKPEKRTENPVGRNSRPIIIRQILTENYSDTTKQHIDTQAAHTHTISTPSPATKRTWRWLIFVGFVVGVAFREIVAGLIRKAF